MLAVSLAGTAGVLAGYPGLAYLGGHLFVWELARPHILAFSRFLLTAAYAYRLQYCLGGFRDDAAPKTD